MKLIELVLNEMKNNDIISIFKLELNNNLCCCEIIGDISQGIIQKIYILIEIKMLSDDLIDITLLMAMISPNFVYNSTTRYKKNNIHSGVFNQEIIKQNIKKCIFKILNRAIIIMQPELNRQLKMYEVTAGKKGVFSSIVIPPHYPQLIELID